MVRLLTGRKFHRYGRHAAHQEGDFDSERTDEQGRRRCTDGETNGGGSGGGRDLQIPGHPDNRSVAEGDGTGETKNEKGCDAANENGGRAHAIKCGRDATSDEP